MGRRCGRTDTPHTAIQYRTAQMWQNSIERRTKKHASHHDEHMRNALEGPSRTIFWRQMVGAVQLKLAQDGVLGVGEAGTHGSHGWIIRYPPPTAAG